MRYPFDGKYRITSTYGSGNAFDPSKKHWATDYACPTGTPIKAITAGRVVEVAEERAGGKFIAIKTGNMTHRYYHLATQKVRAGQDVTEGQIIGSSGRSGRVTGAHLHFSIAINGKYVDPEKIINNAGTTPATTTTGAPVVSVKKYKIVRGDTFWGLESAWQLPHGTLQKLNPTLNARALRIGQEIIRG